MSAFKTGDSVVCIDNTEREDQIDINKKYTVGEVLIKTLELDEILDSRFYVTRFMHYNMWKFNQNLDSILKE